jgi:DNA-binding MarR family transcriptional regulator
MRPSAQTLSTSRATIACVQVTPSTDLVQDLAAFAKVLLHAGGRDFYREVGELDLSLSQIRILHVLTAVLDEASLKTLADEIGLSLPATSRSVDALVQRGLVTRSENADDRRLKAVRATDEARALADHLTDLRVSGIAEFVGTLSDGERAELASAVAPIVARHRKDSNA